ncbi:MAG: ABC-type antimicrobial peptide transport system permease subunit [Ilumatobacter sp.]|jgi:ABC-type antimicrobial peptide transport system permease subunit
MGIEAVDRTQLRVGVAIEAVTIGLIGSAIGLAGGVGLSTLMKPSTARSAPTR